MADERAARKQQASRCHAAQANHNRAAVFLMLFRRLRRHCAVLVLRRDVVLWRAVLSGRTVIRTLLRGDIVRMMHRRLIRRARLGLLLPVSGLCFIRLLRLVVLLGSGIFLTARLRRLMIVFVVVFPTYSFPIALVLFLFPAIVTGCLKQH